MEAADSGDSVESFILEAGSTGCFAQFLNSVSERCQKIEKL